MSKNVILTLEPAQFDFFTKIFSKISNNSSFEPICIKNSILSRDLNTASIYIDFTKLFGDKKVDLNILDHKKASKIFKSIKTDNPIIFIDDNDRYLVTYPFTDVKGNQYYFTFSISKADECNVKEPEDFSTYKHVDKIVIEKDIFDTITKMAKTMGTEQVSLLFKDGKIKAIAVSDNAVIKLDDDSDISPTNCDMELVCNSLMIFDAEEIEIDVYEKDGKYVGVYKLQLGYPIDFIVYETLVNVEDEIDL
jgi:hypothetical protein